MVNERIEKGIKMSNGIFIPLNFRQTFFSPPFLTLSCKDPLRDREFRGVTTNDSPSVPLILCARSKIKPFRMKRFKGEAVANGAGLNA